jgi:uncharacterized protein YukE
MIDGGGASFDVPPGDPGAVESAAAGLDAAAGQLRSAAAQVGTAGSAAESSWHGPAAWAFQASVSSVRSGLDALSDHHDESATALRVFATALREAQAAADRAGQDYAQAEQDYRTTVDNLVANPPTGPGASHALITAEGQATDTLTAAYGRAAVASAHACADATHAAQVCAAKLSGIAEDVKATGLHKFLDLMAGPGALLGMFGVESEMQSGLKLWNVMSAMRDGDWSTLEKVDPTAYKEVADAVAKYGPDSMEALAAQLKYEGSVADDAFGELAQSATGIGDVPSGFAGALDIVGKIALPIGVLTDVGIMADGQSSGLDKGMAAANLGGIAFAATGTELGGTALALVGIDSVAACIPVAGEVVIAATALFFAGEFVYTHWDDIRQWAGDAGHFAASVYNDANQLANTGLTDGQHLVMTGLHDAGQLVNTGLADGQHLVNAGLRDAGSVATGAVNDGEHLVSSGLHEASSLGKSAVNEGKHLLSDLNPFG